MTRITNFGIKRTYLQAGFSSENIQDSPTESGLVKKKSKRRGRPREPKNRLSKVESDSAAANESSTELNKLKQQNESTSVSSKHLLKSKKPRHESMIITHLKPAAQHRLFYSSKATGIEDRCTQRKADIRSHGVRIHPNSNIWLLSLPGVLGLQLVTRAVKLGIQLKIA